MIVKQKSWNKARAELFPLTFLGGILLVISAMLRHLYRKLIIWSFIIAVTSLVLGQALAVITGLANGDISPSGWQWMLVMLTIIIYIIGLIGVGVGGILLLKNNK